MKTKNLRVVPAVFGTLLVAVATAQAVPSEGLAFNASALGTLRYGNVTREVKLKKNESLTWNGS